MIDSTTVSHHRGNKQPLVDATVTAKFTVRDFNGLKSYNKYYKCSLGKLSLFIVNNSIARYLLSEPFLIALAISTLSPQVCRVNVVSRRAAPQRFLAAHQ